MDVNRNPLTTDHLSIGRGYKHQILTHYLPFNPFFFPNKICRTSCFCYQGLLCWVQLYLYVSISWRFINNYGLEVIQVFFWLRKVQLILNFLLFFIGQSFSLWIHKLDCGAMQNSTPKGNGGGQRSWSPALLWPQPPATTVAIPGGGPWAD